MKNLKIKAIYFIVIALFGFSQFSPIVSAAFFGDFSKLLPTPGKVLGESIGGAHTMGQNIKGEDGTVYFINKSGQRRAYTSAGAFLSYRFNIWKNIIPATTGDMALPLGDPVPPRDGSIICSDRGADKGTCYVISEGKKVGFPSKAIFLAQGYKFEKALSGDVSFLETKDPITNGSSAHAPGAWINWDGTVYVVAGLWLSGVSDINTLESWGVNFVDIVPVTEGDKLLPVSTYTRPKLDGELNPLADDDFITPAKYNFSHLQTVTGGPDYIITDISLSPTQPTAGQPIMMTFSIKNIGQTAGVRPRYVFVHTPKEISATLANYTCFRDTVLQPTQTCTDSWQLVFSQTGPAKLDFIANSGDEDGNYMPEADYNNNKAAYNFTVNPAISQGSSIKFNVQNNSSVEAGQFYMGVISAKVPLTDLNLNYLDFKITGGSLPNGVEIVAGCNPQKPRTTNELTCAVILAGNPKQAGNYPLQITGRAPSGETGTLSIIVSVTASSITPTPFTLDFPKGGEQLQHGQAVNLSWTGGNANTVVEFTLLRQWVSGDIPSPIEPDPFMDKTLKNSTSTLSGGTYTWAINPSLPSGQYLIYACLSNALNTSTCLATAATKIPFTVSAASSGTPYNDQQRLVGVLATAVALELYFNDRNMYPNTLADLVPGYLNVLPTAPIPADGSCTQTQNAFTYAKVSNNDYTFGFCLGSNTQSYTAGPHVLTPAGVK